METLWILVPVTYIESSSEGDVLIASVNAGDYYNEESLLHFMLALLNICKSMLRSVCWILYLQTPCCLPAFSYYFVAFRRLLCCNLLAAGVFTSAKNSAKGVRLGLLAQWQGYITVFLCVSVYPHRLSTLLCAECCCALLFCCLYVWHGVLICALEYNHHKTIKKITFYYCHSWPCSLQHRFPSSFTLKLTWPTLFSLSLSAVKGLTLSTDYSCMVHLWGHWTLSTSDKGVICVTLALATMLTEILMKKAIKQAVTAHTVIRRV